MSLPDSLAQHIALAKSLLTPDHCKSVLFSKVHRASNVVRWIISQIPYRYVPAGRHLPRTAAFTQTVDLAKPPGAIGHPQRLVVHPIAINKISFMNTTDLPSGRSVVYLIPT